MSIIVKGKIIREVYKNGAYRILAFSPIPSDTNKVKINNYGNISLVGELGYLNVNEDYEIKIEEKSTDKYGTSYNVLSVPSLSEIDLKSLSLEESKAILMTFTTENQANNILKAYPDFINKVVTEGADAIDTKLIYGVGSAYLKAYVRELNERYKYVHIIQKYADYELNITDCKTLYEEYINEENIAKSFAEIPYYLLIEILGRSFEKADDLLCRIRPELVESEQRCEAMIMDVLHTNENNGSSRLKGSELWGFCQDYDGRLLPMVKDVCENSKNIYYNDETKDVAIMNTYLGEVRVANFIKDKVNNSEKLNLDWEKYRVTDDGFSLSDSQLGVLKVFCESGLSIVKGYSGCGKTFSVKQLIKMLEDNNMTYTLLSPTGKASRVLAEQTGRTASTIHKKCFEGDINTDVVIVDESGMVSLEVMNMLISSCTNEHSRFVFVGDPAQIPSIALGKIYEDMIKSEIVPSSNLTEVFRYKSNGSLFVATNVRQGKSFFKDTEMVKNDRNIYTVCDNYKFIETEEDYIADVVVDEYFKLIDKNIKPKDILILAPQNVGEIGTYALNNIIQAEVNPPKANEIIMSRKVSGVSIKFRVGDLVINTKNDYKAVSYEAYMKLKEDSILTEQDVCDKMIVNGQIGIIREIIDKEGMLIQFDEDLIFMNKGKLNQLLLGYSISTFKAQGSTTEYTINIVSSKHSRLLSRGLLYVADTRNKKKCVDIGNMGAYENALNLNVNDTRNTFLLELLTQNVEKDLTN